MGSPQQMAIGEAPRRRTSASDVFTVLLLVGWCALGGVKIAYDVREYHAQQAAAAAFATRFPPETLHLFAETGSTPPTVKAPYDPALARWVLSEILAYLLTLTIAAVGCKRVRRRRASVEVKWIETPRRRAVARPRPAPEAASGNLAADRLSAIVWSDRVARQQKELA